MQKVKRLSLIAALCLLFLSGAFLAGCSCSTSSSPFTRDATNNDIVMDLSEEFSLNITYKVTPNVDIEGLEITFRYYDDSNKLLATKVKEVGNVKKGIQYSVYVSFGEFSFWDLLKFKSTSARVTGGSISVI